MGGLGRPTAGSVQLTNVVTITTPPVMRYEPGNPDADTEGFVAYPAINPVSEMVDLDGRRAGISDECLRGDGRQADDSAIDRHFEIFVNGERTMSNVTLGAIPNFYMPNVLRWTGRGNRGRQLFVGVVECRARRRSVA
jgi:hypothetical protein